MKIQVNICTEKIHAKIQLLTTKSLISYKKKYMKHLCCKICNRKLNTIKINLKIS